MDNTMTYVMMASSGLLMAMLPFGVFMGLTSLLSMESGDMRIFVTFVLAFLAIAYLSSFGSFALIQRQNCGSIKNMSQITSNAALSFGIQAFVLFLAWLFPILRRIITNLLPPDLDPAILTSVGYSYYGFWGALFGIAVGGQLSGICT